VSSHPTASRDRIAGGVATSLAHDSARKHVTGEAVYIDDMPEPAGLLHGCLGLAEIAHGTITAMDLSAVRATPGVVLVLTADDMPASNDISPTGRKFHGQPIFAVVAETREAARRACRMARIDYEEHDFVVDIADLDRRNGRHVTPPLTLKRGDATAAIATAPRRLSGTMAVGGQDHFYLEGHIALAVPGEDMDVTVHSSTQHPSEVQHMVAHVLGVPSHAVTVEVRRMGGGFGGKETQSNQFAAIAAVAAKKLGRAVKIRLDRDDDMVATGKRHDFLIDYEVGFDDDGAILGVDFHYAARCGFSSDLSGPVTDRALFHCDNAYFYPAVKAVSAPLYTNTVSNTAFRGFGGPQGMMGAERIVDEVAFATGLDPRRGRTRGFQRLLPPPPHHCGVQRQFRDREARDRADARQVRDLVHRHPLQPSRRAGARLFGRIGSPEPRRHRDGAGALRQGGAGRCGGIPDRRRSREDHGDDDGKGAQHVRDGRLVRH
jgi:xanthine dehydrogenase large subunit